MRRCILSKRLRVALAATAVVTLGLSACTIGTDSDSSMPSPTLSNSLGDGPGGASSGGKVVPGEMPREVVEAVKSAQKEFGGLAGAALATPDKDSEVVSTGDFKTGPAWSTSKVPIAVAYVRQMGVDAQVESAITVSDNDAAESMWYSLGDDATAGATTNKILREGHDARTVMGTDRIRAQYTVFGQTQWDLRDQAVFGANLQCIEAGPKVADLMGQIADEQSYGLGRIRGAHFKGGWGPDDEGVYLVRQFGYLPGKKPGTFVGVAIAAQPDDGTYETGQQMLDRIAKAIERSGGATTGRAGTC